MSAGQVAAFHGGQGSPLKSLSGKAAALHVSRAASLCCDDCCEGDIQLRAHRLCNLMAPLCLNPTSPDHPAARKSQICWIWIQRDHKIPSAKLEHEKVFLGSSVLSLEAEGQPVPDLQLEPPLLPTAGWVCPSLGFVLVAAAFSPKPRLTITLNPGVAFEFVLWMGR